MSDQPSSHTFINSQDTSEVKPPFIPVGHVALGTVLGATLADGLTPIHLPDVNHDHATYYAGSNQVFTQEDIGQTVTCIELQGVNQIIITGILMASPSYLAIDSDSAQLSALDEAIATTQHAQSHQPSHSSHHDTLDEQASTQDKILFNDAHTDLEIPSNTHYDDETPHDEEYTDAHELSHPVRTIIKAQDSISLQCGSASITLLADGRIKINGKYIHSRATHTQRISGSVVKVN